MKKTISIIGLAGTLYCSQVFGAYYCYTSSLSVPSGYNSSLLGQKGSNCATRQRMYFCSPNDRICDGYDTCATCPSGMQNCTVSGPGSNCSSINYYTCQSSCGGGGTDPDPEEPEKCEKGVNCFDDEYFVQFDRMGYRRKMIRACDTQANICRDYLYVYICDKGYYGIDWTSPSTSIGNSSYNTCIRCPLNGVTDVSSSSITSCYLWSGAKGSDETGTYTIEGGNCYWAK